LCQHSPGWIKFSHENLAWLTGLETLDNGKANWPGTYDKNIILGAEARLLDSMPGNCQRLNKSCPPF
jgi:hypothetical protein